MAKKSSNNSAVASVPTTATQRSWTPKEILEYRPESLNEVFEHQELKAFLQQRLSQPFQAFPLMVEGPDGEGIARVFNTYLRSLLCDSQLPPGSPVCGKCYSCRWFADEQSTYRLNPFRFWKIDGATETAEDLKSWKTKFQQQGGRCIVQIDNMHHLSKRKMEHLLLIPLAEAKDTVWLASTINRYASDRMIRRRFLYRMAPQFTNRQKFEWLIRLCSKFDVKFDKEETARILVEQGPPPSAYPKLLATAAESPSRKLTTKIVKAEMMRKPKPVP